MKKQELQRLIKAEDKILKYVASLGLVHYDVEIDIIPDLKMIEIMGTFDIVFYLDTYMAGVHEVSGKTQAEKVAKTLAKSLREMLGTK